MGKFKRKSHHPKWTEEDMMNAIQAVSKGRSQRRAADLFHVPRSCLQRRLQAQLSGDAPPKVKRKPSIFSKEQESKLKDRILNLASYGLPLTHDDVRSIAFHFAKQNKIKTNFSELKQRAGWLWLKGFLTRHPDINLKQVPGLPVDFAEDTSKRDINKYFTKLSDILKKLNITGKPQSIYSVDETCIVLNKRSNVEILLPKDPSEQASAEKSEVATVVACCNAVGYFTPPLVIFNGNNFHNDYGNNLPNGSILGMTESGWINEDAFLLWLKHFQAHRTPGPCLLTVNGHDAHKGLAVTEFCERNDIHTIYFPNKASHLQPLTSAFFKPLKTSYNEECDRYIKTNGSVSEITRSVFGKLFRRAWNRTASVGTADIAFSSTGIYPFNPNVLEEQGFSPCTATSHRVNEMTISRGHPSKELNRSGTESDSVMMNELADISMLSVIKSEPLDNSILPDGPYIQ